MDLASRIKQLADSKHITIAELERQVGISNGQIRKWNTRSPKADNLKKVADFFDVSIDYLLDRKTDYPDWATEKDRIDLDKLLQSSVPMGYGGMSMSPEDREKVRNVIEGIYWDRLKELREKGKK
ncbi:helix-turn-helix domain-containing protein [Lactiplantibacillus plantarum]|uniref:helix-turn-helix domain-containing protein n=1 Tax=Lactiplantibacillus plantarum TaxID=1590 RepID=UPI003F65F9AA